MTFPYELPMDPFSVNMDSLKLSNVIERFKQQQLSGAFPGGQLVVRRHGKMVANVAIGIARGFRSTESITPIIVTSHTPFPVYSTGKPLAAIAIAMLEERGLLDLNAPIADIIPEFSRHHKETITTLDVLTHTAGIIVPSLYKDYKKVADHASVLDRIIDAKPVYKRGTFAYMPWEFGVILCEIMQRIVGKTISTFVNEEIVVPLNLPALRYGFANRQPNTLAHTYWFGKDKVMIAGCNVAENFEVINNSTELLTSENPAFSMVTDAASLAAFYEFLLNRGLTRDGQQLISEDTLRRCTSQTVSGWNKSLKAFVAVGKGFMLGTWYPSIYGWYNTQ